MSFPIAEYKKFVNEVDLTMENPSGKHGYVKSDYIKAYDKYFTEFRFDLIEIMKVTKIDHHSSNRVAMFKPRKGVQDRCDEFCRMYHLVINKYIRNLHGYSACLQSLINELCLFHMENNPYLTLSIIKVCTNENLEFMYKRLVYRSFSRVLVQGDFYTFHTHSKLYGTTKNCFCKVWFDSTGNGYEYKSLYMVYNLLIGRMVEQRCFKYLSLKCVEYAPDFHLIPLIRVIIEQIPTDKIQSFFVELMEYSESSGIEHIPGVLIAITNTLRNTLDSVPVFFSGYSSKFCHKLLPSLTLQSFLVTRDAVKMSLECSGGWYDENIIISIMRMIVGVE